MTVDNMTEVDEANQILDNIVLPTGEEDNHIIKYKGENYYFPTQPQQVYMCQEISKQVFGKTKERFAVVSTPKILDLISSSLIYGRADPHSEYGMCIIGGASFHDRELLLKSGLLIPDPEVRDINGELRYLLNAQVVASEGRLKPLSRNVIDVEIDKNNAAGILAKAGILKAGPYCGEGRVEFGKKGMASLGYRIVDSYWNEDYHSGPEPIYGVNAIPISERCSAFACERVPSLRDGTDMEEITPSLLKRMEKIKAEEQENLVPKQTQSDVCVTEQTQSKSIRLEGIRNILKKYR